MRCGTVADSLTATLLRLHPVMNHTETNTAMEIMLSDFHYYFTMTGEEGGLCSFSMEFEPNGVAASSDEMKEVVRCAIATHTDLLDRILSEMAEGEKKPTMIDTSHQTSIGYHYRGNLTRKSMRNLGDHLQSLFGERVESLDTPGIYRQLDAKVVCELRKNDGGFTGFKIKIDLAMGHAMNVCLFHFAEKLGVAISDDASTAMRQLQQTLQNIETAKAQGNIDHYKRIIGS